LQREQTLLGGNVLQEPGLAAGAIDGGESAQREHLSIAQLAGAVHDLPLAL